MGTNTDGSGSQGRHQQLPTLSTLPDDPLSTILHKAGLHTRQVCRAFYALHPPLLALVPQALSTADALSAALAALSPNLTSLDLSHIACCTVTVINAAHLATITTTLPRLQRLLLPPKAHPDVAPELYLSLSNLPRLHTLSLPGDGCRPPPPNSCHCLTRAPIATRLRSLALPCNSNRHTLVPAPPATFPQLTSLCLSEGSWNCYGSDAFAPIVAAAPALVSLEISESTVILFEEHDLAALAALTALKLATITHALLDTPGQLLQLIGTLTALRSLSFTLQHRGWTPEEAGWLSCLVQLTHLAVRVEDNVYADEGDEDGAPLHLQAVEVGLAQEEAPQGLTGLALVVASVARDAARLPLLQDLELGYSTHGLHYNSSSLACGTPHSFIRHLAAATQLRRLCLENLPLPTADAHLLSSLQQLSCLLLTAPGTCTWPDPPASSVFDVQWVSSLQLLRRLAVNHHDPQHLYAHDLSTLLPVLLGPLTSLHTLSLRHPPTLSYAQELPAVLVQLQHTLVRLDLGGCDGRLVEPCMRPALVALGSMRQLQGLDMYSIYLSPEVLAPHLLLPRSLRCCYLSAGVSQDKERQLRAKAAAEELQRQYPSVAFRFHCRQTPWCGGGSGEDLLLNRGGMPVTQCSFYDPVP